jgi:hypothetical protein
MRKNYRPKFLGKNWNNRGFLNTLWIHPQDNSRVVESKIDKTKVSGTTLRDPFKYFHDTSSDDEDESQDSDIECVGSQHTLDKPQHSEFAPAIDEFETPMTDLKSPYEAWKLLPDFHKRSPGKFPGQQQDPRDKPPKSKRAKIFKGLWSKHDIAPSQYEFEYLESEIEAPSILTSQRQG